MSGLLSTLTELFGTNNLYEVLQVPATASDAEIQRGYRKRSLQVHPDRVSESERAEATKKFQALGAAYKILAEKDRRAVYDECGEVDDESDASLQDGKDWDQYWRLLFQKITPQDIANFEKEYRNSEEELNDLKQAYLDGKGDMKYILDSVLCCSDEDEERFSDIIQAWIEKEEVPHLKAFRKLTAKEVNKRKRKATKEAAEAEELAKELGIKDEDSLTSLIKKRQEQRGREAESFLDGLAEKYGKKEAKGKGKGSKK